MEKYGVFDISNVSISNLNAMAKDESRAFEMRLCELSFFAESAAYQIKNLLADGMNVIEALALLSEEIEIPEGDMPGGVIEETKRSVRGFLGMLALQDKANFARLLRERLLNLDINVDEGDFLPVVTTDASFIYVKSALADEAFDVFSQEYSDARVMYADSFKKACFDVADKKSGYCILPFEERFSVRIPSIAKLVSDLDLKIIAITPVFGFEGNADTKYALIGRSFKIPERDEFTDRYLEITVPKSAVNLHELLTAADIFGAEVYKVGTSLTGDDGDNTLYSIIFKDGGESFSNLLVYLSLFVDDYVPVGIYKNIE